MPHRITRYASRGGSEMLHIDRKADETWHTRRVVGPERDELEETARASWVPLHLSTDDAEEVEEDEPKYAIATIVEQIRDHGVGIRAAGKALNAAERGDPGIVRLLRERVTAAASFVWEVEMEAPGDQQPEHWHELVFGLNSVCYRLSVLAVAAQTAAVDPNYRPAPNLDEAWWWCRGAAQELGSELVAWAEKHGEEASHA